MPDGFRSVMGPACTDGPKPTKHLVQLSDDGEGRDGEPWLASARPPAVELATLPLGRPPGPAVAVGDRRILFRQWAVVDVALDGNGRANSRVDLPRDLDDAITSMETSLDAITDRYGSGGLRRSSVHPHMTAPARIRRLGARLAEPD
jgi:hypothetical protein